ncbi:MAG: hypothetical protein DHS20C16_34650 [Phycisphaerae bacterium]|nr:MAG: hypothetical protein DHS20C16_34650 [Phycisphaerae bacterium]
MREDLFIGGADNTTHLLRPSIPVVNAAAKLTVGHLRHYNRST